MHTERYILMKLKAFTDQFNELRTFRKNMLRRTLGVCFRGLKANVLLSKFELKNRIKNNSIATFWDRHLATLCFARWAKRANLILKIDELEEKIERVFLKRAVKSWKSFAWPKKTPVTIKGRLQMIEKGGLEVLHVLVQEGRPLFNARLSTIRATTPAKAVERYSSTLFRNEEMMRAIRRRQWR